MAGDVVPISRWVLAADRLPPVDEIVLAHAPDFRYSPLMAVWDGEWWRRPGPVYSTLVPVTHWQPMPDPPE